MVRRQERAAARDGRKRSCAEDLGRGRAARAWGVVRFGGGAGGLWPDGGVGGGGAGGGGAARLGLAQRARAPAARGRGGGGSCRDRGGAGRADRVHRGSARAAR